MYLNALSSLLRIVAVLGLVFKYAAILRALIAIRMWLWYQKNNEI